jgi:hypothetical protein
MSTRSPRRPLSFLLLLLAPWLAAAPTSAGILEGNCRVANQPAATLLIPYFEVDLGDANGQTTLISVNNASSKSTLARVVLWTDWGVPTLAFDVFLTGYDVQTLNLRDLFQGNLPNTGPDASNNGLLSQTSTTTTFDGCFDGGPNGVAPKLVAADVSYLRAPPPAPRRRSAPAAPAPAPVPARRGAPTWRSATSRSTR